MKLRSIHASDIVKVADMYMRSFAPVDPSEQWTQEKAVDLIKYFLRVQPDLAFIAEVNGEVAGGICGIVKPWWDGNHLVETELFVAPEFQRQGVGSSLFRHLLSSASDKYEITWMESITFKVLNFPASWYKKLGFTDKDDWKLMFGEVKQLLESFDRY